MSQSTKHELMRQAVESGTVSGIFYVLVANLPPGMNFCDLKTLARKVSSVDKCFINPKTYEGWVRVRNVRDFQKICNYLNGLEYKGHRLSASGENETSPVHIWDQKKSRSATNSSNSSSSCANRGRGELAPSPYANAGPSLAYEQCSSINGNSPPMEYNATYHNYDSGYSSGASSQGYHYPAEQLTHTVTAVAPDLARIGVVDAGGGASCYTAYQSPGNFGYAQDYDHSYNYSGFLHGHDQVQCQVEEAPQTIKVIVKNLSRHASAKELETYLLKAVGGRQELQEDIRFPRQSSSTSGSGSSSSSSRQHAFLMFNTHNDALTAISKLDKVKILGLTVEARLATETVLPLRGMLSTSLASMASQQSTGAGAGASLHTELDATLIPNVEGSVDKEKHRAMGDKSHNLVVDGRSVYGHVKKAVEETKARDRKHKHKK